MTTCYMTTCKHDYILQYADDTALTVHAKTTATAVEELQTLTDNTTAWFYKCRLTPNPTKNQLLLTNHKIKDNSPTITTDGNVTTPSQEIKYLGITLGQKLKFTKHAQNVRTEIIKRTTNISELLRTRTEV